MVYTDPRLGEGVEIDFTKLTTAIPLKSEVNLFNGMLMSRGRIGEGRMSILEIIPTLLLAYPTFLSH